MSEKREASSKVKNRLLKERAAIGKRKSPYVSQLRRYRFEKTFFNYFRIASVALVAVLAVYEFVFSPSKAQESWLIYGEFEIKMWVVVLAYVVFYIGMTIIEVVISRRRIRKASRAVCLYASVSAAESLEQGNTVEAGYFAKILFSTMKDFAESAKVKMGLWKPSLKEVFLGDVEKVWEQRKAISKAIVDAKELRNQFSNHLYLLANQLFSLKTKSDHNKARESLQFIMHKSQKYWVEPTGFFEKHKNVRGALSTLNDFLKIALAPIMVFILWLFFGYMK